MINSRNYTKLKIGTEYFFIIGLPEPQGILFTPFSMAIPVNSGKVIRLGYKKLTIVWKRLDFKAANALQLRAVVNSSLSMVVPLTDGSGVFKKITGIVQPISWKQTDGSSGLAYENVSLVLNNVTVEDLT